MGAVGSPQTYTSIQIRNIRKSTFSNLNQSSMITDLSYLRCCPTVSAMSTRRHNKSSCRFHFTDSLSSLCLLARLSIALALQVVSAPRTKWTSACCKCSTLCAKLKKAVHWSRTAMSKSCRERDQNVRARQGRRGVVTLNRQLRVMSRISVPPRSQWNESARNKS